ncbi:tyrosine-protein kinase RYK isoform X3 [Pan troglodytes]|uniref:tyrosine-protein kinase RYK isoform X3 n=1 Tax=Pan troglodytes TaxID=9598 RepID=UPI0030136148
MRGAARLGRPGRSCLPGARGLRAPPPPPPLLLLLALLPLLPAPGAAAAPAPRAPELQSASAGPSVSLYLSEDEVRRLIGLDAELYYVRNDLISHYALSFNLLVPSETNFLHFTWHAKSKVEYKLGFQVDNVLAMDMPQVNISVQGEVPRTLSGYPTLRIEKNDLRSVTLLEAKAKVKDIAISRERITLKDVLQEGTFGRIFHGILIDEKDPNKEKQAFVKTVKDQASEIQVTMMLTESCKLRGLHHRNLLPITHVCIEEGEKPMVILPYMNWGNLKLFLRQCKLVEANNPQAISQQDLVHMAIQIACGMSYLARREVIHKDLAARNCVIDDTLQVKITDNALSRDLFPMDYHCLGDNENRPVRWMALESLVNNEFSSASDVWAFGVTLWELMTLGQTPYVDIDPFEMAAYLKDGYRIAQPINCPDELFAVMACCWALDPEERPKFQQLVQCLTEFHAALGAYV